MISLGELFWLVNNDFDEIIYINYNEMDWRNINASSVLLPDLSGNIVPCR